MSLKKIKGSFHGVSGMMREGSHVCCAIVEHRILM